MLRTASATTVTVLFIVACAGCQRGPATPPQTTGKLHGVAAGCNFILISMDTTRADRLGCYGYDRGHTPNLDALARRGVQYEHAFAHVPITLPSHTCLLTGTYPPENGVRVNGKQALGPSLQTLAEIFKRHGYKTAAILGSVILDSRYGLDRGFDTYDDDIRPRRNQPEGQRAATEVCDRTLQWLSANAADNRPFMCFVHFYDPHTPYSAPREFLQKIGNLYDAEVAYMDAEIGRLIEWLEARSLMENTLLVVIADHGESLGEHRYQWHSLLVYHSIVRIPLLVALPGRLPESRRSSQLVRMVDVAPTVLDLMGWDAPEQMRGESFQLTLAGERLRPRLCYGETEYPLDSFGWSNLRFLVDANWKYIRAPQPELYDLNSDPGETRNLADAEPERLREMEAALARLEQNMTRHDASSVSLSAEDLRKLRSLGYVSGAPSAELAPSERKNPRDMPDVVHAFREAEQLYREHRVLEVIRVVERLVARSPESFVLVELLGKAYAGAGVLDYAERTLAAALDLYAESADTHEILARVLHARGAVKHAIAACNNALAIAPDHAGAKELLPQLAQNLEEQRTRIAALRRRRDADRGSAELSLELGDLLIRSGDRAAGLRILKNGQAQNPEDVALTAALAWQLATAPEDGLRDGEEAIRLAQIACQDQSKPRAAALDALAAALAEGGRFEEAVRIARRGAAVAQGSGDRALALAITRRLHGYQEERPYRSPH